MRSQAVTDPHLASGLFMGSELRQLAGAISAIAVSSQPQSLVCNCVWAGRQCFITARTSPNHITPKHLQLSVFDCGEEWIVSACYPRQAATPTKSAQRLPQCNMPEQAISALYAVGLPFLQMPIPYLDAVRPGRLARERGEQFELQYRFRYYSSFSQPHCFSGRLSVFPLANTSDLKPFSQAG